MSRVKLRILRLEVHLMRSRVVELFGSEDRGSTRSHRDRWAGQIPSFRLGEMVGLDVSVEMYLSWFFECIREQVWPKGPPGTNEWDTYCRLIPLELHSHGRDETVGNSV